jgi:hypothetical protein
LDDRVVFVEAMTSRASGRPPQSPAAIASAAKRTADDGPAAVPAAPDVGARARREPGTLAPVAPPSRRLPDAADATGGTGRGDAAGAPLGERRTSSPDSQDVMRAAPSAASDRTTVAAPQPFESPWQIPDGAPTAAGGLLFLLPVLERVGFAKWAEEHGTGEPQPEVLAAEIFHQLLTRLGVSEDDPTWELALPTIGAPGRARATLDELWLTTCRRFLRRRARIGLASLVLRPARVALTATHVDVFFRLTTADVRIRRAGLDIDPGWVPWFGRVVAFHYGDRAWN